jgi:uncharacterized protein
MVKAIAAAGLLVGALLGWAHAAGSGPDCARPKPGSIQALICGSPLASALDAEATRLERLAGASAGQKKARAAWLKARDACVRDPAPDTCLRDRYLARIAALRTGSKAARSADDKGISFGPAAFHCERTDSVLHATFVNTEPPLVYLSRQDKRLVLQVLPSGSGARYVGPDDQLFWEHHDEARYRESSATPEVTCKKVPAP